MSLIDALQNYLVVTAAIATVVGAVRFLDGRRLKIAVRGVSEVTYDAYGKPTEAFVFYVVNDRDHPITVEACGAIGQDTGGRYWPLSIGMPAKGVVVAKGAPYRWEMPFAHIAEFGLDVDRTLYGFARVAQPAKEVWSRGLTAGPTRGPITRAKAKPLARPAGQSPSPPPWWVRNRK